MASFASLRRQRNAREPTWAARAGRVRTDRGEDETATPALSDAQPPSDAQSSGPTASADTGSMQARVRLSPSTHVRSKPSLRKIVDAACASLRMLHEYMQVRRDA